eukprot:Rmarinus@m.2758
MRLPVGPGYVDSHALFTMESPGMPRAATLANTLITAHSPSIKRMYRQQAAVVTPPPIRTTTLSATPKVCGILKQFTDWRAKANLEILVIALGNTISITMGNTMG